MQGYEASKEDSLESCMHIHVGALSTQIQGYLAHKKLPPPPLGPPYDPRHMLL